MPPSTRSIRRCSWNLDPYSRRRGHENSHQRPENVQETRNPRGFLPANMEVKWSKYWSSFKQLNQVHGISRHGNLNYHPLSRLKKWIVHQKQKLSLIMSDLFHSFSTNHTPYGSMATVKVRLTNLWCWSTVPAHDCGWRRMIWGAETKAPGLVQLQLRSCEENGGIRFPVSLSEPPVIRATSWP